jgi:type III secretory pathway component EscS
MFIKTLCCSAVLFVALAWAGIALQRYRRRGR